MTLGELAGEGRVVSDYALGGLTTYRFGGDAAWYAEPADEDEVALLVSAARTEGVPVFVLGRGSNVVIADSGYPGLVIKLAGTFTETSIESEIASAGAAVSLPKLARACAAADRGGLEFYVGIPGSVGGAIVMNAGGHGSDTAAWLIDARVFDMTTGQVETADPISLDLSYRHSRLGPNDLVLSARFRTIERPREESEALMREITAWRREHQPGGTFNAGSVFKNPPGDAAGRLIDSCGLKGFAVGGAAVSERHANFFVADESATAQNVYDLVAAVRERVREVTGVDLQPEIRFIGDYGAAGD